jgi:hypothetical protein
MPLYASLQETRKVQWMFVRCPVVPDRSDCGIEMEVAGCLAGARPYRKGASGGSYADLGSKEIAFVAGRRPRRPTQTTARRR